jgi:transmembrane sensor
MTAENRTDPFADEDAAWEALARYLDGRSAPAEAEAVRAWLAADPSRVALVRTLEGPAAQRLHVPAPNVDVEAALRAVKARMHDGRPAPGVVPLRRVAHRSGRWTAPALRIAAAVVLLIGGALLVRGFVGRGGSGSPARTYATAVGERRTVGLPDGTRVLLGPGSRLAVARGYGGGRRDVELTGEALFEVPHDASRPFTVRAGAAVIRDLGTRFTVQTGEGAGVRVVVSAGSVSLAAGGAHGSTAVVLAKGDRGVMRAGEAAVAQRGAGTDDDLAWTRGRLVFRDAPLEQVAAELRRWYGIKLRTADPAIAGRVLTASFKDEPPGQIVRVVALALGAELEMRGDTAVLRRPGGGAERP